MPTTNTKAKQPLGKHPKLPALLKPSYVPQMGSLYFAVVMAFLKLGAIPSQGGACSRTQLLAAVKELQSEWEGMEDPPLAVKDDPEGMVDLPVVREHLPRSVTRLQYVEYKLKHRRGGSVMVSTCRNPKLRLSEEGEATARYLLERHLRRYKVPMPGFEDFNLGAKEERAGKQEEEEVLATPTKAAPSRGSKRRRQASANASVAAARGVRDDLEEDEIDEEEGKGREEGLLTPTKAAPAKRRRRSSTRAVQTAADGTAS